MASVSRPDLLPLASPRTIGLPFHGKVENDVLTLPSSATRSYTQPADGGCIMVQHTLAAALTRTAAEAASDTANDYRWQTYALLSGRNHQIGGHDLGAEYHLYCDASRTWKIKVEQTEGLGSCAVKVYLCGLFGVLSDTNYTMADTLLAQKTWTPLDENGAAMPASTLGGYSVRTFSKTGGKALLMVGTYYQASIASAGLMPLNTQHQGVATLYIHDLVRVTVSGNGSTEAGTIGTGITATIDQWSPLPYETYQSSLSGDPAGDYSLTQIWTRKYLFSMLPNGSETDLEYARSNVFSISNYVGSPTYTCDVTDEQSETTSFGGTEIASHSIYVGDWDASRDPDNQGTWTTNSASESWSYDSVGPFPTSPNLANQQFTSISPKLPLAVYVEPSNLTPSVIFAGGSSASTTTGAVSLNWAYDPGDGSFATATGSVSFV